MLLTTRRLTVAITTLIVLCLLHGMLPVCGYTHEDPTFIFLDEPIPPYTYGVEGDTCKKGLSKEIFDELFGRLGLRYEIRLVPWARAMDSVKHGRCDGIPLLMKNGERESFMTFTAPVVENRELLYYASGRLGHFRWNQLGDLRNYELGLVRGYTYADSLLQAIEQYGVHVTYSKDSKMNFRMLEAGRVDLIVEDETLAKSILAEAGLAEKIVAAGRPVSSYFWHIGVSNASPLVKRLDAINRALETMRSDGSLARILDRR